MATMVRPKTRAKSPSIKAYVPPISERILAKRTNADGEVKARWVICSWRGIKENIATVALDSLSTALWISEQIMGQLSV